MNVQRRTFSVLRCGRLGEEGHRNDLVLLEQELDALERWKTTATTPLQVNYLFGCVGRPYFLLNLKNKATKRLVDATVKDALGPRFHATAINTTKPGEKFAPGRRKQTTTSGEGEADNANLPRPIKATIELHAEATFGADDGRAILLGVAGLIKTFVYDCASGLVPKSSADHVDREEDYAEEGGPGSDSSSPTRRDKSCCSSPSMASHLVQSSATTAPTVNDQPGEARTFITKARVEHPSLVHAQVMEAQRKTFAVILGRDGEGEEIDRCQLESVLKKLTQCQVAGKTIRVSYVFGCLGRSRFLVNLKTKATGRLADSIVKNALGAFYHATPFETRQLGEKFVPGRSLRKRRKSVANTFNSVHEATIEREAARTFGSSDGMAVLLAPGGKASIYSYDAVGGLVLQGEENKEDAEIDVGCEAGKNEGVASDRPTSAAAAAAAATTAATARRSSPKNLAPLQVNTSPNRELRPDSPACISDASCDSFAGDSTSRGDTPRRDVALHLPRHHSIEHIQRSPRPSQAERTAHAIEVSPVRAQSELSKPEGKGRKQEATTNRPLRLLGDDTRLRDVSNTKNGRDVGRVHVRECKDTRRYMHSTGRVQPSDESLRRPLTEREDASSVPSRPKRQKCEIIGRLFSSRDLLAPVDVAQVRKEGVNGADKTGRMSCSEIANETARRGIAAGFQSKGKASVGRKAKPMPIKKLIVDRWRKEGQRSRGSRGCPQSFAQDLYNILEIEDSAVIGWHNRKEGGSRSQDPLTIDADISEETFLIRDSKRFCREIMPRYFDQLHHYSVGEYSKRFDRRHAVQMFWVFEVELDWHHFRKVVTYSDWRGNQVVGYAHSAFRQGKPHLLSRIQRSIPFEQAIERWSGEASAVSTEACGEPPPPADIRGEPPPQVNLLCQKAPACSWDLRRIHPSHACCPRCAKGRCYVPPYGDSARAVLNGWTGEDVTPGGTDTVGDESRLVEHRSIFRMGKGRGNCHMWVFERPSASEAAECLSQRCTLDEVIAILSAPPKARGCRKEAKGSRHGIHLPDDTRWNATLTADAGESHVGTPPMNTCDNSDGYLFSWWSSADTKPPCPYLEGSKGSGTSAGSCGSMRFQDVVDCPDRSRSALVKTLGHLGFQFEEQVGDKASGSSSRWSPLTSGIAGGMGFGWAFSALKWGGEQAMTLLENLSEFHDSLLDVPISWRSMLSKIVLCLPEDSQRAFKWDARDDFLFDERNAAGQYSTIESGGSRKRKQNSETLKDRASTEILKSVMKETWRLNAKTRGSLEETVEDEVWEAASAARTIESMHRARSPSYGIPGEKQDNTYIG